MGQCEPAAPLALLVLGLAALPSGVARSPLARASPCGVGADELVAPTGVVAFRTRLHATPLTREWTIAPQRPPSEIDVSLEGTRIECRRAGQPAEEGACTLEV
ncbi:hypothetical protein T492DRAFT_895402 [Pavlovales sp. CCMP2436]|nr:hypothetical protein T492DRAFT_895402 [Pavlovales sp. CCMP2436]